MEPYVLTVTLNPALDKTIIIDRFEIGGLNRVKSTRVDSGGKGINVAKVLNKFKANVVATGLIAGKQGNMLLDYLKKAGIDSNFHEVQGETRTNLKIVEEFSNITTEINEIGFTVFDENITCFKNELSDLLDNASLLVLSGSLPPGVNEDIYYELIELAKNKKVKTILDADGNALANGIKAIPYAIKPNIHELEKLTNKKMDSIDDTISTAKNLIQSGIEMIIVSMGADGALIIDKNHSYHAKPFKITPKSTVGAGDSMVATLAYSLLNNYDLKKISRLVTAAGTITASKPGTEVCSINEVIASIDDVEIQEL